MPHAGAVRRPGALPGVSVDALGVKLVLARLVLRGMADGKEGEGNHGFGDPEQSPQ